MKGPSTIESCFSVYGCNRQNMIRKDSNTDKNADLFTSLLVEKSKTIKNPEKLSRESFPLNKISLQRMIDVVQSQMNDYLFHELSVLDDDSALSGFNSDWMNWHGSKNFKATPVSTVEQNPRKEKEAGSPTEINDIIAHAAKIHNVDPALIRSVIRAESDFNINATSSKGAMGLMQLMPETAKELGVKNCYNPVENIMAGTRYLKNLIDRYDGNVELSLAAYNWGMGNLEKHPDKLPKETRTYIARVNRYLQQDT